MFLYFQQRQNIFPAHGGCLTALTAYDLFRQLPFRLLQLLDFFLNRVFRKQFEHSDFFRLPDAVRPVCGLVLHRQIPPGIIVDHHIRAGQV